MPRPTWVELAISVVAILAVIALVSVAAPAMGLAIPQWIVSVCVICLVAYVVITAIRLVSSA